MFLSYSQRVANISRGMKLDDRDIDQLEARDTYNVRHSYRATGQSARYKTAMSRESITFYYTVANMF